MPTCPFPGAQLVVVPPLGTPLCEVGFHNVYDEDEVLDGAEAIAGRIRKSGYDIIALNEVFEPDAAEILAAELYDVYPHIVHSIGDPAIDEAHSGLALFSKLPFEPISQVYSQEPNYNTFDAIVWRDGDLIPPTEHAKFLAFKEFGACSGSDCYSTKGVAYVRVVNTDTSRRHNVFFTHMQATYLHEVEENPAVWWGLSTREAQLADIRDMILDGTANDPSAIRLQDEDVFVMGDLNIDGDRSNVHNTTQLDGQSITQFDNLGEWSKYFRSLGWNNGFFVNVLHDTWANEHIVIDTHFIGSTLESEYGPTHGNADCASGAGSEDGCRWDYILHNTPQLGGRGLCNQHPSRAFNLDSGAPLAAGANAPGGRGDLSDGMSGQPGTAFRSDHLGVNANYNVLFEQCSPLLPHSADIVYGSHPTSGLSYGVKTLDSADLGNLSNGQKNYGDLAEMQGGTLHAPGSVQWWRVTEPGTYLIGFHDDLDPAQADSSFEIGYQAQVYGSASLSTPLPSYKKTLHRGSVKTPGAVASVKGHKYIFDDPPYYIKIFHPEHDHRSLPFNSTGFYHFAVRRLGCTDKRDDACPIIPNTIQHAAFPIAAVDSFPTADSLYFDLDIESLTVAGTQQVQLVLFDYAVDWLESKVTRPLQSTDPTLTLSGNLLSNIGFNDRLALEGHTVGSSGFGLACAGQGPTPQVSPLPHGLPLPGLPRCNNIITFHHPDVSTPQTHAWRVRRNPGGIGSEQPFSIVWTTDLTALYGKLLSSNFAGMELVCVEETSDGSPHDEIGIRIAADGVNLDPWNGGAGVFIKEFQQDESIVIDDFVAQFGSPIAFKSLLSLTLIEYDTGTNQQVLSWDAGPQGRNAFGPNSAEVSVSPSWEIDDGLYETKVLFSHGTQRFQ